VPTALLNNAEHNGIVHEHVILVKIHTVGMPHVDEADRITIERLRLGFVAISARYGYQDEPDLVAALELAKRRGLDIDLDRTSYYVDHVTILPTGRARWPAGGSASSLSCTRTRPRSRGRVTSRPTACSRSAYVEL
jgi:KUP system potassium uptake protein